LAALHKLSNSVNKKKDHTWKQMLILKNQPWNKSQL